MSSHVLIKTLKFCTSSYNIICDALKILGLAYEKTEKSIALQNLTILCENNYFYVRISENKVAEELFYKINSKVAEIESQLKEQQLILNQIEQEKAKENEEMYRLRQLKREEELLEYKNRQLELEKNSFVEAKKNSIISKAKEKGYSVQETQENGVVKLKLVRRIY